MLQFLMGKLLIVMISLDRESLIMGMQLSLESCFCLHIFDLLLVLDPLFFDCLTLLCSAQLEIGKSLCSSRIPLKLEVFEVLFLLLCLLLQNQLCSLMYGLIMHFLKCIRSKIAPEHDF